MIMNFCTTCRATAYLQRVCMRTPGLFLAKAAGIPQQPLTRVRLCTRLNIIRPFKTSVRFWEAKDSKLTSAKQNGKLSVPKASEVRRLLQLAHPERWRVAGAISLLVISSGVSMAVPFCIGKVIDIIYSASQEGRMTERLNQICKILLVVFIIGAAANFGRSYLMQISGQNIVNQLRKNLFQSVVKQEMGFFDKTRTGDLVTRLSADTALIGRSVTMNISDGLRSVAQAAGGIGLMIVVSPKLAVISMGIVPPVALASIVYGRYVRKITRQVQESLAKSTEVADEKISNIRTVRAFAHEDKEITTYGDKINHVLSLSYKEALASSIFWGATGLSGNMIVLAVFYFGGHMMTDSLITVGELSAFLLYAAYVGVSIGGLSSFYSETMRGLGASTRLWELVDRKPQIPITGGLVPSQDLVGNIEFRNISFAYPSRLDLAIFDNLTLKVPAGQMTAVVGASGSGKSTLASLILRLYEPRDGNVFIDGHCLRELDPAWVRKHIGTVSQEPILFSTTIKENIAYGAEDPDKVSYEEIVEAAKKANAYNFIRSFPSGFETTVGERGHLLSGGQKQRIAIARAILKNPKILLLDEATSALDAESEYLVQEALSHLMVGRTVLTIAHRLSTIKSASQIAVLHDRMVAEVGTYDSLMKLPDGIFRKLVEHQTITAA